MYTITLLLDGKYACEGRLQDGVERWTEDTLEAAVHSMRTFARWMNNTKLKRKEITFYRQDRVRTTQLVNWNPFDKRDR